ncbi:MAG TPA: hypothetical protein VLU95_00465 [Candidatus Acidoferrum sp.]|nr:hypothetical protein [Candidatus Acidoferrum sp.]
MPRDCDGLVNINLSYIYVSCYTWTIARVDWLNIIYTDKVNGDYDCNCKTENSSLFNATSPSSKCILMQVFAHIIFANWLVWLSLWLLGSWMYYYKWIFV